MIFPFLSKLPKSCIHDQVTKLRVNQKLKQKPLGKLSKVKRPKQPKSECQRRINRQTLISKNVKYCIRYIKYTLNAACTYNVFMRYDVDFKQ